MHGPVLVREKLGHGAGPVIGQAKLNVLAALISHIVNLIFKLVNVHCSKGQR